MVGTQGLTTNARPATPERLRWLWDRAVGGDRSAWDELWRIAWVHSVRRIVHGFFVPRGWADRDDLVNIARIGFWTGLRHWHAHGGQSLLSFLAACVQRKLIDFVRRANRLKRRWLASEDALDGSAGRKKSPNGRPRGRVCGSRSAEDEALTRLGAAERSAQLDALPTLLDLSPLEERVVRHVLDHPELTQFTEHAKTLGINRKCLDNALERIRCKAFRWRTGRTNLSIRTIAHSADRPRSRTQSAG